MKQFSALVIRARAAILLAILLITGIMGYFLKDIKINPDVVTYLPKNDPAVKLFDYIGEKFGGIHLAIVAVEARDGDIFTRDALGAINTLTTAFQNLAGISYVQSLTNIIEIRKAPDEGLEIGKLVDQYKLPETAEELELVRSRALAKEMYRGRIVSADGKTTLILCRIQAGADKLSVVRQIKAVIGRTPVREKIYVTGFPFQMLDIADFVVNDLIKLIPISCAVVILSLLLSFRSLLGVVLPLLTVLLSTVWTLGIMSLLKVPLTLISDTIPVILIAVGSAYGIHVFSKYRENTDPGTASALRMEHALSQVALPVILAGLTTVVGFISFVFGSYLTICIDFGLFSSLGIFFALVISLTLVPAVLSLLPAPRPTAVSLETGGDRYHRIMGWLAAGVGKHHRKIVLAGLVMALSSGLGLGRILRSSSIIDYFKESSSTRQSDRMIARQFGGAMPIQILVKGDILDPAVLRAMKGIEDFLKTQPQVNNPQSVADLIEDMNEVMGDGKSIPESRDKVDNLWFMLEGQDILSQMISPSGTEALIQATMPHQEAGAIRTLYQKTGEYLAGIRVPGLTAQQTGMHVIYKNLDDSLTFTLLESLAFSLVLIFLAILFLFRSVAGGLLGLLPITFTLLVIFGVMGWASVPLDVVTVLIGSVSIGIGIDYTIHFSNRLKLELALDPDLGLAIGRTLATTGKAISINVITVALGFLVLVFANLLPLQRFGALVALTMISSGLCTLTILPAALLWAKPEFLRKIGNKFK